MPARRRFCHRRLNQLSQSRMSGDCQASNPCLRWASPCCRRKERAARAFDAITVSPFSIAAAMDGGSCILSFIPQSRVDARLCGDVYTHSMRRIAAFLLLCVFGALLPSATVVALAAPQQLVPICCRAHGAHACVMGMASGTSSEAGPALRQPGCPFGESLRASTTIAISSGLTARIKFGLVLAGVSRQPIAVAIVSHFLRLSAPRGPPVSLSV